MDETISEERDELKVVLTPPFSLHAESEVQYRAPNILQRIASLFTHVRPGSDLSLFQLPPLFNYPKSQLQGIGEMVYCIGEDYLRKCSIGKTPLDRFIAVVGWSITTARPIVFGLAPYNPILGETHHVSRGNLNVLLEQVSHHPPVAALHATDEKENVEIIWCMRMIPKFQGASVDTEIQGKKELKLLNHSENYVMNNPNVLIRLFPKPGAGWAGTYSIQCEESGLAAELCYKGPSFLGFSGNHRSVTGKIFDSNTLRTIYEVDGHWDRTVKVKDVCNGKKNAVIYDAAEVLSKLKTPMVKDPKGLWTSESAAVWSDLSEHILHRDWDKAKAAKKVVEEKERALQNERKCRGETWIPKHFTASYTEGKGWECCPKEKWVPPAPIAVPC